MSVTRETDVSARSEEIVEKNRRFTLFEWGRQAGRDTFAVDRAKGVYFWDAAGKRYLDFSSQSINVNIGHADDRVVRAIKEQAEKLPFISPFIATEPRGLLGEKLAGLAPESLNKSFITLGGAEANENALRLAFAYTGKQKVLARYRSYHGGTNAMLQLSGDPRRWAAEPGMPGVVRFWGPYPYRCPWCGGRGDCTREYLDHLEQVILHEGPHTIAAVILEPIPGGYGVIVPPKGYLAGVRRLCDQYGILLVADEVMTGFGRTGEWFAVDHEDVRPDILTLSKGLTGGHVPLGVCMISDAIAAHFEETPFVGGLTFNSYALGCAAAAAVIDVYIEDDLIAQSKRLGAVLLEQLQTMRELHPCIGEVRGQGLFAAIEVVRSRQTKEPMGSVEASSPHQWVMDKVKQRLLEEGLYSMVRGNVLVIAPPLSITEEELLGGLATIDRALQIADREVISD